MMLSSCASTKGYYGQSEANVVVISSQRHNVTIGKKNSWEIAYLCKVDDKVVGNNFKGYPSKCKVLPGRRMIEVEHNRQWKDNSTGLMVAGAMFGAIGGAVAGAAAFHIPTYGYDGLGCEKPHGFILVAVGFVLIAMYLPMFKLGMTIS